MFVRLFTRSQACVDRGMSFDFDFLQFLHREKQLMSDDVVPLWRKQNLHSELKDTKMNFRSSIIH